MLFIRLNAHARLVCTWLLLVVAVAVPGCSAHAQTMDDGIMLARQRLCAGVLYAHDTWDHYWEGSRERTNGNMGTVTTQAAAISANYAITSRINVLGDIPFVWTNASQGTLHPMHGFQDLTLAVKVNAVQIPIREFASIRLIGLVGGSTPSTNYTPDLQPLSIGYHSKTLTTRGTVNLQTRSGVYVNGSTAYMFRGHVSLDRPYYYTNNQLTLSNQVAMPNQFSYVTSVGYYKRDLKIEANFMEQQTRGGGDIRRQDLPFVSNRMNYARLGGTVQYPLPRRLHDLQYWFTFQNTVDGRNVGHANTITTGLMYTFHFERSPKI